MSVGVGGREIEMREGREGSWEEGRKRRVSRINTLSDEKGGNKARE